MGDLIADRSELDSINLFYSALVGRPSSNDDSLSFKGAGYDFRFFISFSEHGNSPELGESPDIFLWNRNEGIALLLEMKGGSSIDEEHLEQINATSNIPLQRIQQRLQNILNDNVTIRHLHTGIVYMEDTYQRCLNGTECRERIKRMQDNHLFFTQQPKGLLNLMNQGLLLFDPILRGIINDGIRFPPVPPRTFYMTKKPCQKGVIWGLTHYIHDQFFSDEKIEEYIVNPVDINNTTIRYSNIPIRRVIIALEILKNKGICLKDENNNYVFRYEHIRNIEYIRNWIENIDCQGIIPPIQDNLDDYIER